MESTLPEATDRETSIFESQFPFVADHGDLMRAAYGFLRKAA
jgi:hypothetical protein